MTPNAPKRVSKINRSLVDKLVVFDGFDGKQYTAFVERVRNGVATLRYSAGYGHQSVIGYVSEPSRLWWR